ncbi:alpha/beta fold hydrolase [Hamadaea tsunoensis]|uniref:alpha/beta fold hydrolase n=1 Tax=Hamadaea tsunoensis TaxID=53368 RepID=UPI000419311E|nr:alpha/beta hydrolase [Hamadaea tsunoensis]
MSRPTFVFVHGANGSAGVWSPVVAELVALGHRAVAVDLPGHGLQAGYPPSYQTPQDLTAFAAEPSAMAGVTLDDTVDHLTSVVRRVAAHGPVILIGQSLGGISLTGVANRAPELVEHLVYVSAFCCVELPTVYDYYLTPEGSPSAVLAVPKVGDPARTGALRTNWRSGDPEFLASARRAFLADSTEEHLRALIAGCQPDESVLLSFTDARIDPAAWGRVPHTFVRLARDQAIPPALQDRMIAEADRAVPHNPFRVHTLESSHLGYLTRPAEISSLLARLADGKDA